MRGNSFFKKLDFLVGSLFAFAILPIYFFRFLKEQMFPFVRTKDLGSSFPGKSPRRILIIKLAALGDSLLLIPVIRSLRERYPQASISFLGTSLNEDLILLYPDLVNEFLRFDVKKVLQNWDYLFRFIFRLRENKWDLCLDFEQWSYITALLSFLSGSSFSLGMRSKGSLRHWYYHRYAHRPDGVHEINHFFNLLDRANENNNSSRIKNNDLSGSAIYHPILFLPESLRIKEKTLEVRQWLLEKGWKEQRLIHVHPGCGGHGFPREWPVRKYVELCDKLRENFSVFFVFSGLGPEQALTQTLAQHFPACSAEWNSEDLAALIALLPQMNLLISGNTGIMHLAAAAGIPQVALHGPTDEKRWGPLNPRAVVIRSACPECPCLDRGHEYHRTDGYCMNEISVNTVFQACKIILEK